MARFFGAKRLEMSTYKMSTPTAVIMLILLSPSNLLGLFLGTFHAIAARKEQASFQPFIISVSLLLASVNATKLPEGDLYNYLFKSNILSESNLGELLRLHSTEPGYYFANWVHVSLLGLDWTSWVFVFTFFFYCIWLNSISMLLGMLRLSNAPKIALLICAAFFPLVFAQSAHLVRQYLGGSLALLGVVYFLKNGRGWGLFLTAPLVHVVSAIFLSIPTSAIVARRSFKWALVVGLSAPIALIGVGRLLAQNVETLAGFGLPTVVTYGLQRLSQNEFHSLSEASMIALSFSAISAAICLFSLVTRLPERVAESEAIALRLTLFLNFQLVLSLSTIIFNGIGLTEPGTRVFQFVLLQFPFSIAILLAASYTARNAVLFAAFLMPILLVVYPNAWNYGSIPEVLLLPYYHSLLLGAAG